MSEELTVTQEFSITLTFKIFNYNEIIVGCKEFPEVVTQGNDLQDAIISGADAICEAIAGRLNRSESLWECHHCGQEIDVAKYT